MGKVIKKVKRMLPNGNFDEYVYFGADSDYVDVDNNTNLTQALDNINNSLDDINDILDDINR